MTRISCVLVAFACFILSGCGQATVDVPDEAEAKTTTPIEDDLKAAGMEGMSQDEYLQGGKQE